MDPGRDGGMMVVIVVGVIEQGPPALAPGAAVTSERAVEELRAAGILAWTRRREPRLFDEFRVISMPLRATARRRGGRASPGRSG